MKENIIEFLEWVFTQGKVDLVDISYLVDGEYYSQLPWEIKMKIVDQFMKERVKL